MPLCISFALLLCQGRSLLYLRFHTLSTLTIHKKAVTMRAAVLLSLLAVVYGAQLRFDAVPSSVRLPDNAEECGTVDDAATIIANLLGLTAERVRI